MFENHLHWICLALKCCGQGKLNSGGIVWLKTIQICWKLHIIHLTKWTVRPYTPVLAQPTIAMICYAFIMSLRTIIHVQCNFALAGLAREYWTKILPLSPWSLSEVMTIVMGPSRPKAVNRPLWSPSNFSHNMPLISAWLTDAYNDISRKGAGFQMPYMAQCVLIFC